MDLIYKVNSYGSYAYNKLVDINSKDENLYNEWYFSTSSIYHRTRLEDSVWSKCNYSKLESNTNALLYDADFRQLSEDMFINEDLNVYTLEKPLYLYPKWNGWIKELDYMKIETQEDGAKLTIKGLGNVTSSLVANIDLEIEILYNQGTFARPDWIYNQY